MSRGTPWTEEEDSRLRALRIEGKSYFEIAALMDRTYRSIQARLSYHNRPWAERAEANRLKHENRKPRERKTIQLYAKSGYVRDIPEELLVERDRRLLAERSLTAIFCGDPAPGFSALERR